MSDFDLNEINVGEGAPPTGVNVAASEDFRAQRSKRFLYSVVTAVLTRPLAVVISLVSVPLFLRYLGTERYGLYESVGALAMWLSITNAGMGLGLLNRLTECYVSDDKELARRYVTTIIFALCALVAAMLVIVAVCTPFVPWGAVFRMTTTSPSETAWAFWWAGSLALVGVVVGCTSAIYLGYQEIVRNHVWDAISKIVTLIGCVAVVFTPLGVTGAILATAGAPTLVRGVNLLSIFFYEKPFLRPKRSAFQWSLLRVLLAEGAILLVLQLSAIALFQTDKLIIGFVKGPAAVPEFAVVGRLYLTAYAAFVMLIGPLWPTAGEAIRRGDILWVRRTLRRSLLIGTIGMTCVGLVMFIFGDQIVSTWTRGAQPTVSRALVVGLTVTFVARCCTECQSIVLNSANVLMPQAWLLVGNAVLNCGVAFLLVYKYGAVGAAWSIPIATALTSGWMYPLLLRKHLFNRPIAPGGAVAT